MKIFELVIIKFVCFQRTGKDYPIYSPSILCKINPRNPGCGKTKSGGGLRKNNASQNQNQANQNKNWANQNQNRASQNQNRANQNQNRANQNRANQNQNRAGNAGSTKSQTPGFPKKVN